MLTDYIRRFAPDRVLWIDETRTITAGDLIHAISAIDNGRLRDKKVVLRAPDPIVFAQSFILLDSIASSVLLLPHGSGLATDVVHAFQPDLVLTDAWSDLSAASSDHAQE